jgi:tetratricopeptide (TPR) repeat protein
MKKWLLLMCTVGLQASSLAAGTMQEIFLQANAAYMAGKVQDALELYQSINPKGPAVWYNMGNCYNEIGNYPEAIVQWRRAQKHASWRDFSTLEQYIRQAYQAQNRAYKQSIAARGHAWIMRCASLCSVFMLQLIFLWFLWALFLLGPALFKNSRYFLLTVLSLSTFLVACGGFYCYHFQECPYGIVTKNVISVYAGPGRDYARLTEAKVLDSVRVYQMRDGWLKVYIDQCGYGWLEKTDL